MADPGHDRLAVLEARIADLERQRRLYRTLVQNTSAVAGVEFFRRLSASLSETLGLDCAFIAELVTGHEDQVRTRSVWLDGALQQNFSYALAGTPCETVMGTDWCAYPSNVQQDFPDDELLIQMGMESYAGIPLVDREGHALGLCSVMSRAPMHELGPIRELLGAAAIRASMELERMRAEEELRSSEERLRTVATEMPALMDAFDGSGHLVFWNREAERVSGYTAEELVGNPRAMELLYPDEDYRRRMLEEWERRGNDYRDWEWELTTRDGSRRVIAWYNLSGACPIPGWASWGVGVDVTERHEAEASRELLARRLLQAQKMEAMGQLAGGVAHEFNNLLTTLLGHAELLREAGPGGDPDAHFYSVERILEAGQRAAELTRQLLTFGRRMPTQPITLDLNELLAELRVVLGKAMGEGITLLLDLAPERLLVRADPAQLEQVVLNLTMNARDAMEGRGRLSIQTRRWESASAPFDEVWMTVADDGSGMTSDVLAKATDPFFTTKPRGAGTGLGLTTVQSIVVRGGGRLEIESEPGRGTKVHVGWNAIPDTEHVAPPFPSREPSPSGPGGKERILVCEDQPSVREFVALTLRSAGYQVFEAFDGVTALERARNEAPIHLFLSDVILPDSNGPQVFAELSRTMPGVEALFMSGYPDNVLGRHGLVPGHIAFLAKPFTAAELLGRVREVCDRAGEVSAR